MFHASNDWEFEVEGGEEWLFFRLRNCTGEEEPTTTLGQRVWDVAEQRSVYRLVIELRDDVMLSSALIGQLVLLHKRCHQKSGAMRLCGVSATNYQAIETMRLADRLPNYRTREDAVAGRG